MITYTIEFETHSADEVTSSGTYTRTHNHLAATEISTIFDKNFTRFFPRDTLVSKDKATSTIKLTITTDNLQSSMYHSSATLSGSEISNNVLLVLINTFDEIYNIGILHKENNTLPVVAKGASFYVYANTDDNELSYTGCNYTNFSTLKWAIRNRFVNMLPFLSDGKRYKNCVIYSTQVVPAPLTIKFNDPNILFISQHLSE